MRARRERTENATGTAAFRTGVDNSTSAKLYRFSPSSATSRPRETAMLSKIRRLSPEQAVEVDAFLDTMIRAKDKARQNEDFLSSLSTLSEESFARLWDNPKDAEYDDL